MNQASTVAESDVRAAVGVMYDKIRLIGGLIDNRATLALVLCAHDPRLPPTATPVPDRSPFFDAVFNLFRSLGVDEGAIIPNALRAQVLDALGLHEPPVPAWLKPGVRFFEPWRGARGEAVTVARIIDEGVVLRREDGREEEPVPMGWFLDAHKETDALPVSSPQPSARAAHDGLVDACSQVISHALLGQTLTTDTTDGVLHDSVKPLYGDAKALASAAAQKQVQPKPAAGHVWRHKTSGPHVVLAVGDGRVVWKPGASYAGSDIGCLALAWECIGLQLHDGRLMVVGDTWVMSDGRMPFQILGVSMRDEQPVFAIRCGARDDEILHFSVILANGAYGWRKVEPGAAMQIHAHVVDASGSWCTRCGGEPDGSCVETRGHIPRGGGPCPGCATCRPSLPDLCRGCGVGPGENCAESCPRLAEARAKATHECPKCGYLHQALADLADVRLPRACIRCAATLVLILRLPSPEGVAALRAFWAALLAVVSSEAFRKDAYRRRVEAAMVLAGASTAATAERAAVLAACEQHTPLVDRIPEFIPALRRYEAGRARGMTPARARLEVDGFDVSSPGTWSRVGLDVYERERGR